MKKLLLLLLLLTSFIFADLSVNQIRDRVMKIHKKREGINLNKLDTTQEPFIKVQEDINTTKLILPKKSEETKLILHAILNNRAYINDRWNSVDDNIGGYILKYIGKKGVVLRNENQIKKLFLNEKKENFIIIGERE